MRILPRGLTIKIVIVAALFLGTVYVHYHGKIRFRFFRQLSDHSTILAPINSLMYLFSAVPHKPYLDLTAFPELKVLQDHWQTIRDEGLKLVEQQHMMKHIFTTRKIIPIKIDLFYSVILSDR